MRPSSVLIVSTFIAAAAFASAASAQTIQPIAFSPAFEEKLHEELGAREGEYLRELIADRVNASLARRGIANTAPVSIEISIVDADPNRPTMEQTSARPGLDSFRSISTGGAELRAVLRGADGAVISEVEHRYFTHSLDDLRYSPSTWSDASRSIRRFAEKVADAYAAAG